MPWFANHHSVLVIAVGAGVVVGAGVTLLIQRLNHSSISHDLAQLVSRLESLQKEVTVLRTELSAKQVKRVRKRPSGYYSVHESSGEDEDIFEEAYESGDLRQTASSTTSGTWESATEDDLSELWSRVDGLLDNGTDAEKEHAFQILQEKEAELLGICDYTWRLAKAHYMMSQVEGSRGDAEKKKSLVYSSLSLADKAVKQNGDNPNAHKWYALTLGSIGDYEGVQAKIKNGYIFKDHILQAIQLNPADAGAHYLLGRWAYGVYMLTWIERRAASALFATPPTADIDEALHEFLEADRLSLTKWKENELYIAKCYFEKKNYTVGATWLEKANNIPTVSADDREAQDEVDKLLYKYSSYIQ